MIFYDYSAGMVTNVQDAAASVLCMKFGMHMLNQHIKMRYGDESYYEVFENNPWQTVLESAVKAGNLNVLKWIKKNCLKAAYASAYDEKIRWSTKSPGLRLRGNFRHICLNLYPLAASEGHVNIMKWCQSEAGGCLPWKLGKTHFPWHFGQNKVCSIAAYHRHLEALRFARNNGCPWDKITCVKAAEKGQLEILMWARKNGCQWNTDVCTLAAMNGHLDVLMWAHKNGCQWDESVCSRAARNGHLDVLKYSRKHGCPYDASICVDAARFGNLKVLQWLTQEGCHLYISVPEAKHMLRDNELKEVYKQSCSAVCDIATDRGDFEILQWATQNGFSMDEDISIAAARCGDLKILKWLTQNGCHKSKKVCVVAAYRGDLKMLQWATRNGYPLNKRVVCDEAEFCRDFKMLEWAKQYGQEPNI